VRERGVAGPVSGERGGGCCGGVCAHEADSVALSSFGPGGGGIGFGYPPKGLTSVAFVVPGFLLDWDQA
jgi:hypothetical protein